MGQGISPTCGGVGEELARAEGCVRGTRPSPVPTPPSPDFVQDSTTSTRDFVEALQDFYAAFGESEPSLPVQRELIAQLAETP
jgi:hypothetical protein